jgi:hypothetical protein
MGHRTEAAEKEIEFCDICGKDIPEPYGDDGWDRVRKYCKFCKRCMCGNCWEYVSFPGNDAFGYYYLCQDCLPANTKKIVDGAKRGYSNARRLSKELEAHFMSVARANAKAHGHGKERRR